MEGFNVERAQTLSHVFHFFTSAGKACLAPFLTLYFRYLGLSAFQTGLIVGLQCLVAMVIGPLWLYCANACRKRRLVLVFSLVVCIASGVLLSVVPTAQPDGMAVYCNQSTVEDTEVFEFTGNMTEPAISTEMIDAKPVSVPVSEGTNDIEPVAKETPEATNATTTSIVTVTTTTTTSTTTTSPSTTSSTTSSSVSSSSSHNRHSRPRVSNWDSLSPELKELIKSAGYSKSDINKKDPEEFQALFKQMQRLIEAEENVEEESGDDEEENGREKRDILASTLASINDKLASWQIESMQVRTLAMVLVIVLVAEVMSAPIETLADTLWFEFLDGLDFLERYGSQRVWSTLGLIVFPLIVTSVVDRTHCMLTDSLHHFALHFYFYAAILTVAFMLAFCFPIFYEKKKVVRRVSIFKGCGILFTDVHAFCYIFTIILLGLVSACLDNFLFWKVQDLDGAELYMGGAVSLAAVSQFFFLAFSKLLIRKLSNPGCIILALLILCLRLVIYSFLWAPWVVLPTALLYGFSHTLIFVCIENYQDFKANPLIMDRSAKALIDTIYKGIAYGGGSMISGFLFELLGWGTLLQGGALVVLSWAMLFAVLQRCIPHKHKVRYAKLLQAEEDQESDEEESVYDGDWLEIALKHDK